MNFLNEAALHYRDAISFAAGQPPSHTTSAECAAAWMERFVQEYSTSLGNSRQDVWSALGQYGPTNGIIGTFVAKLLARDEHINVDPRSLMITNGMQEAVTILLLGLFDCARDVLLSDDPTYVGLTGAARLANVPVVPLKGAGSLTERAERALAALPTERRARALYVIPDFCNPSGVTYTLQERLHLLDLARARHFFIIEDTAYRYFRYEGEDIPSLKALDTHNVVVQLGSFSKMFMPGPRLGYLLADQRSLQPDGSLRTLAEDLSRVKSFVSVLSSPVAQAMLAGMLIEHDFSLRDYVRRRREACRRSRDALLAGLAAACAQEPALAARVSWSSPEGGFFLVVHLPFPFRLEDVTTCARDYGVVVCPMRSFSATNLYDSHVRLSFSNVSVADAHEGAARFMNFVASELQRRQALATSS